MDHKGQPQSALDGMVVCRDCDALLKVSGSAGTMNRCPRCGCTVRRAGPPRLESALALYVAATIFFLMANAFPILSIEAAGNQVNVTLIGAALALQNQNLGVMSWVVLATTVAIPALELGCALGSLLFVKSCRASRFMGLFLRIRDGLRPWSMLEIFVLGALVAFVKLGSIASVIAGAGIWSLGAFMLASAAANHAFDPAAIWRRMKTEH